MGTFSAPDLILPVPLTIWGLYFVVTEVWVAKLWFQSSDTALKENVLYLKKGKSVPLQAWSGPEGSRKLRFPDEMTTAQDGGKVVRLKHRPPLLPRNAPGTHFMYWKVIRKLLGKHIIKSSKRSAIHITLKYSDLIGMRFTACKKTHKSILHRRDYASSAKSRHSLRNLSTGEFRAHYSQNGLQRFFVEDRLEHREYNNKVTVYKFIIIIIMRINLNYKELFIFVIGILHSVIL